MAASLIASASLAAAFSSALAAAVGAAAAFEGAFAAAVASVVAQESSVLAGCAAGTALEVVIAAVAAAFAAAVQAGAAVSVVARTAQESLPQAQAQSARQTCGLRTLQIGISRCCLHSWHAILLRLLPVLTRRELRIIRICSRHLELTQSERILPNQILAVSQQLRLRTKKKMKHQANSLQTTTKVSKRKRTLRTVRLRLLELRAG